MAMITVRTQEAEDFEALTAIMDCPGVIAGTLQLPYRSREEHRALIARRAAAGHGFVAVLDGQVVGQLDLQMEVNPRRRHVAGLGMAVHDDFQGRGVGSALMAAATAFADNWLDLRRIELEVYTDNAAAIHLYEKFGFVREGLMRAYAYRNGAYVDACAMARLRGPA